MVFKAKSETPVKPLTDVKQYQSWQMPDIEVGSAKVFRQPIEEQTSPEEEATVELISEQELKSIKESAYAEAFEQGRQEGLNSAKADIEKQSQLLSQMIEQLAHPLHQCGEKTEQELLELAFAISRQIVRRELKQDPTQLIAIIRDALAQLPIGSKNIQILLHPEDASVIREVLSIDGSSKDSRWQLVEEPAMEKGGCLLKTDNSTIDASVDRQIAILFSRIAGGERAGEDDANG